MKRGKINIGLFVFGAILLLILLRFGRIIDIIEYLFTSRKGFSFETVDAGASILLIIILLILPVIFRKKKFISWQPNTGAAVLILLIIISVFAPVAATFDPDKHHDITVTKLLPPLSLLEVLYINKTDKSYDNIWMNADEEIIGEKIRVKGEKIVIDRKGISRESDLVEITGSDQLFEKETLFFIFGTDQYGRDLYSRIIYGTRLSVFIGLGAVMISSFIGILLGFVAGYYVKILDSILNRFTEMFLAFPIIFLIILLLALFGNSIWIVIVVLGLSGWMSLFKIVRGEVVQLKQKDFVISSKLLGYGNFQILRKEILPGLISPVTVNLIFLFSNVIIAESALSFLGLGIGSRYPTWGSIINQGQYFLSSAWWIGFFPCAFLSITLISVNSFTKKLEQTYQKISVR